LKLQTIIPLEKQSINCIDYQSNILLFGSCFAENIGQEIAYYKFRNYQNPFGVLFNPIAIERLISFAVEKKTYIESDIFFYNERWHCFDAHSDLSASSKEELLQNLNNRLQKTYLELKNTTHIIITLGTAWVYKRLKANKIVANCHKVPQKQFSKELLSVEDIKNSLNTIISSIKTINDKASIIFTVSPVRHLKDGFVENQQSKAHLITAVQELLKASDKLYYFPAYELMMDELRDYRFYKEDLIHPNKTAIKYIWQKFKEVWIASEAYPVMEEVEAIQKGLSHKPFNEKSETHQIFIKKLSENQKDLEKRFPFITFNI